MRNRHSLVLKLSVLISQIVFANYLFAQDAPSTESRFDIRTNKLSGILGFGLEVASFESTDVNILGFGPRAAVDWNLGAGFSVSPCISLAIDESGNYLYTGFAGYLRYSIFGNSFSMREVLNFDGKPIVEQEVGTTNRLSVAVGIEQLLLNGTQFALSAAGVSGAISYSFTMMDRPFEFSGRYSLLTTNDQVLSGFSFNIAMYLGL